MRVCVTKTTDGAESRKTVIVLRSSWMRAPLESGAMGTGAEGAPSTGGGSGSAAVGFVAGPEVEPDGEGVILRHEQPKASRTAKRRLRFMRDARAKFPRVSREGKGVASC